MSDNFLLAAVASATLLTGPALAAVAPTHAVQSATTSKTKTASTKTAPTKMASTKAAPTRTASAKTGSAKIAAPKTSDHNHHAKMAKNVLGRGNGEVRALNALESAGYRQFNNLHASGTDFVATAMKAGQSYDVTVTPQGRIEAKKG